MKVVGVGSKVDVNRKHPKLLQHLKNALFGRNW
jgi:hypothetical protein